MQYNKEVCGDIKLISELDQENKCIEEMIKFNYNKIHSEKEFKPNQCELCTKYSGCPFINECEIKGDDIKSLVQNVRKLTYIINKDKEVIKEYYKNHYLEIIDNKEVGYKNGRFTI